AEQKPAEGKAAEPTPPPAQPAPAPSAQAQPSAPPKVIPFEGGKPTPAPVSAPPFDSAQGRRADGRTALASPAVRRLAREIGVDINAVEGTGPGGRISQEDVKEHARR